MKKGIAFLALFGFLYEVNSFAMMKGFRKMGSCCGVSATRSGRLEPAKAALGKLLVFFEDDSIENVNIRIEEAKKIAGEFVEALDGYFTIIADSSQQVPADYLGHLNALIDLRSKNIDLISKYRSDVVQPLLLREKNELIKIVKNLLNSDPGGFPSNVAEFQSVMIRRLCNDLTAYQALEKAEHSANEPGPTDATAVVSSDIPSSPLSSLTVLPSSPPLIQQITEILPTSSSPTIPGSVALQEKAELSKSPGGVRRSISPLSQSENAELNEGSLEGEFQDPSFHPGPEGDGPLASGEASFL